MTLDKNSSSFTDGAAGCVGTNGTGTMRPCHLAAELDIKACIAQAIT